MQYGNSHAATILSLRSGLPARSTIRSPPAHSHPLRQLQDNPPPRREKPHQCLCSLCALAFGPATNTATAPSKNTVRSLSSRPSALPQGLSVSAAERSSQLSARSISAQCSI